MAGQNTSGICRSLLTSTLTVVLLGVASQGVAEPSDARQFDVILLVDASPEMAMLSRKSAMVVVEAMGDRHRLGITTFGKTATVIHPLGRIATVSEKMAALETLDDALFEDSTVNLTAGLASAMASLTAAQAEETEKIIVLLTGAPSTPATEAEKKAFKAEIPPALLKTGIRLFVVAKQTADIPLLQQTANLTGGKLLAAFDLETMTDALDLVVEKLAPPKTVVVTKEVPVRTRIVEETRETADEELARNTAETRRLLVLGLSGATAVLLLLGVLVVQLIVLKRLSSKRVSEHAAIGDNKEKSGFAKLRDLANTLNNTVVDAAEMVSQLNLDLEDFGVEKWRTEKGLVKAYGEIAAGLFLMLDHLSLRQSEDDESTADWARRKIARLLEDAGIEVMKVDKGERFDGLRHKHVGEETSDLDKGCVIAVKRKGYVAADPGKPKEKLVLRQAEVIVSLGEGKGNAKESQPR